MKSKLKTKGMKQMRSEGENHEQPISYSDWLADLLEMVEYKPRMKDVLQKYYDRCLSPNQARQLLEDSDWVLTLSGIEDWVDDVQMQLEGYWSDEIERNVYSWYPEGITAMDAKNRVLRMFPKQKYKFVVQIKSRYDLAGPHYWFLTSTFAYETFQEYFAAAFKNIEDDLCIAYTKIKAEDFDASQDLPF